MRLADECVPLQTALGYLDHAAILKIALETGAEAIHPGYGFLAESIEFIAACREAGVVFIGPPLEVMLAQQSKIDVLNRVKASGLPTLSYSARTFDVSEIDALRAEADRLGYPLDDQIDARRARARGLHRAIGGAAGTSAAPRAD